MKKLAVILSGSGYLDGSEIRESVGVLWAASQLSGVEVQCFAPDAPQADVVNCLTGKTSSGESRNILVESARIARGKIAPLSQLVGLDYSALILPGGFGAAKNLSSFAKEGSKGTVHPELKSILTEFHSSKKPIGAICIAPAILALSFPNAGFSMTLGETSEASQELEKLGHLHEVCGPDEICLDSPHRIITTPAYMHAEAPLHKIFEGIHQLVVETIRLSTATSRY